MYNKELLFEIFTNEAYRTVDNDGKIFPPSHPIYKTISLIMKDAGSDISEKHIYTILNVNRNGAYDRVLAFFHIVRNTVSDDSADGTFNVSNIEESVVNLQKTFRLVISAESWSEMIPESITYGLRKYVSLKPGKWTDIIAKKIWEQAKIECALSFKKARVFTRLDSKCFARFSAKCTECDAKLCGHLYEKPRKNTDAIFECTLSNICPSFIHKRKRQLKGNLRQVIASTLVDQRKDASTWRAEEAQRIMQFGDAVPALLYNATVLRKAKQEEVDKRLGVKASDALTNLYSAMYTTHQDTIRAIGLAPFYCMYWTAEQQLLYKLARQNDISHFMTMDATGSVAKRLRLPNGEKSAHLFLYQCLSVNKLCSVPVFQMVSAKQDASIITYFLLEILRSGIQAPRMTVTDFGRAILIAIARAFANCTDLRDYLGRCYNAITTSDRVVLPACYIRLDVSHFVAMIARWNCLKKKPAKVRQFYLRSLSHCYQIESFKQLEYLLESILVVALSQELGKTENQETVQSDLRLIFVNNVIKGALVDDPDDGIEEGIIDETNDTPNSWVKWSKEIFEKAKCIADSSNNGDIVNAYYNIEAAERLYQLLPYIPIWTGIMRPYFKVGDVVATSATVEAEFSSIKSRVFKGQLPMRVDKWVLSHSNYLQGKLKLMAQEHTSVTSKIGDNLLPSRDDLNTAENWRGLVGMQADQHDNSIDDERNSKKMKPSYLTDCADWDVLESTSSIGMPLIRNGSLCDPVRINKSNIIIHETCAFDSLIQIFANGVILHPCYKEKIMQTENPFFNLIGEVVLQGKILKKHYADRAAIISEIEIFKKTSLTRNMHTINANCNAAHLTEYLFHDIPSYTTTTSCHQCSTDNTRRMPILNVNIDILISGGLNKVQEAIDDVARLDKITCKTCHREVDIVKEYGPHLITDTSLLTDPNYKLPTPDKCLSQDNFTLNSINKSIMLDKKIYKLAGVVSYKKYDTPLTDHYTACTHIGLKWYIYDDMKKKRTIARGGDTVAPHVILYVQVTE